MRENLKDILSQLSSEVDQQILLKYLEGKLTSEQQHDVEKKALDDDFEADALEGLQDIPNKAKIALLVEGLNQDVRNKTKMKKWPRRREAKVEPWLIITIVIVLAIAVISYFIIHRMKHP